jgi:hypothetical protein
MCVGRPCRRMCRDHCRAGCGDLDQTRPQGPSLAATRDGCTWPCWSSAHKAGARGRAAATERWPAWNRLRMGAAAMSSKRKPISRPPALQITPLAISLFTEMTAISCTCAPRDWGGKYWVHEQCAGCKRWRERHARLHDELRCRPWEWPCIQSPEAESPYPPGSPAAQSWRPNERAQQMWQALARAAREARRTKRARDGRGQRRIKRPSDASVTIDL